jgi:hypothetical protein
LRDNTRYPQLNTLLQQGYTVIDLSSVESGGFKGIPHATWSSSSSDVSVEPSHSELPDDETRSDCLWDAPVEKIEAYTPRQTSVFNFNEFELNYISAYAQPRPREHLPSTV